MPLVLVRLTKSADFLLIRLKRCKQEDRVRHYWFFVEDAMSKTKRVLVIMSFFVVFLVLFFVGLMLLITYMFSTMVPVDLFELWALLIGQESVRAIDAIDVFFIALFTFAGGAFVVAIGREMRQRTENRKERS